MATTKTAEPSALADHPYAEFVGRVQKPGRYLGAEEQQITKDHATVACSFVLAFPDVYEIGMSHLGTRILYDLINKEEDLVCERSFSPWIDVETELRERGLPLVSLETYTPLSDFDVVGVSLQYELCYSNVLLNLELGGVPLRSADRGDDDPIVLAGGPTATHPEPLTPFVDALLVGEAEEVLPGLLRTIGTMRRERRPRQEILVAIARTAGMYVPAFYEVASDERTGLQVVTGRTPQGVEADVPERVGRVYVRNLDDFPFPDRFPVPFAEAVFDRASVEVTRGCTEGCRFCQAGIIYRPVRERSPDAVKKAVLEGVDAGGFDETSLTALSTADVSCINPLIKELVPELAARKVSLGIASLRAYGLSGDLLDEIKSVGITGLTFAPEAGTQRMRDVINKNVTEEDIDTAARRLFERGMDRMKMYFIMGLPTETDEDVVGILETGRRVRELGKQIAREQGLSRVPQVTCSVSQHIPKPHTPFQWAAMDTMEDLETKVHMLRDRSRRAKVGLKTHDVRESWLECLFARGDRRLGEALEIAYRNGARFDGWQEHFKFDVWLSALEEAGIEPERYTQTLPVGARLPWDHIEIGLEPDFLESQYRKALASRLSPPCGKPAGDKVHHTNLGDAQTDQRRLVCYDCGIACDMSQMRSERIVALRSLSQMTEQRLSQQEAEEQAAEAAEAAALPGDVVPMSRLAGRLASSNLDDNSAFKHNAEAPHSRLRIVFGKHGPLRFLSHLDLLRIMPRMFRRARIELAFSRGYNPVPRMSFGPALALGMRADAEVVDVDLVLDESARDMTDAMTPERRIALAAQLLERLRAVAPPGLALVDARLVEPGEFKLGQLVAAADYDVELAPQQAEALAGQLADKLAGPLMISREVKPKKRKGKRRKHGPRPEPTIREIDVHEFLMHVELEDQHLRFRLRVGAQGGVRPREVVEALLGETIPDHRFGRRQLLADADGTLTGFTALGVRMRPVPPPRPREHVTTA